MAEQNEDIVERLEERIRQRRGLDNPESEGTQQQQRQNEPEMQQQITQEPSEPEEKEQPQEIETNETNLPSVWGLKTERSALGLPKLQIGFIYNARCGKIQDILWKYPLEEEFKNCYPVVIGHIQDLKTIKKLSKQLPVKEVHLISEADQSAMDLFHSLAQRYSNPRSEEVVIFIPEQHFSL